jgi:peptidoglycan hydrolase-like protein with peptidoglycan-binding domain
MRTIQGVGAFGDLVRQIQTQLNSQGFNTGGVDGQYGGNTSKAVSGFQTGQGTNATGTVDDQTWASLMQAPVPAVAMRSLQLTASFEGHGFTLAVGNFDGAGVTWGIIGFNLKSGTLQQIVLSVNASNPEVVAQAFGANAAQLLQVVQDTPANQIAWANSITVGGRSLAQPWLGMFAAFGSNPVVQAAQIASVNTKYMTPAIQLAQSYNLVSELGLALCFDIRVQNGSINPAAAAQIASQQTPGMTESQLLPIIATAVGQNANPNYVVDVLSRKMTIATGNGKVHGANYVLVNWGLEVDYQAAELTGS